MRYCQNLFPKLNKIILIFIFLFLISFLFICFLPDKTKWDNSYYSKIIFSDSGEILRVYLNKNKQWCIKSEKLDFSQKLEKAVLLYEDKNFYYHIGFDLIATLRALKQNIYSKKIISGASTITMQLMRISESKKRTYWNKFKEVVFAIRTEIFYSKKEILSMYLERAPYGVNIMGVSAASQKYFRKEVKSLSWAEASLLAVLPNSPGMMYPGKSHDKLKRKRDGLLLKLRKNEIIDKLTYDLAIKEEIPSRIYKFPQIANHLSDYLYIKSDKTKIKTTIDKELQIKLENIVSGYKHKLYNKGIHNASVLIAETKTGKIKAYIGSQDYFNNSLKGKIDGVKAKRSSGSVLKPLLFASAMDKGLILPQMKIEDVKISYKGISPENYNKKFNGVVSVQEALVKSLNVPAVKLLEKYSVNDFYVLLKKIGFTSLFRNPYDYGLGLIIGSAEVTLFDLVQAYCILGNYGNKVDLFFDENKIINDENIINPGACYLTLKMLEELKRPGFEQNWKNYSNSKRISWKTGTSFGHRDAWAVGTTENYTVGVWVGNFDGESNKNLVGTDIAAPLMFDAFNLLDDIGRFEPPLNYLETIKVCAKTFYPASQNCEKTTEILRPINNINYPLCPFCKVVQVDDKEEFAVCSNCWETHKHHKKNYVVYSPAAQKILKKNKIKYDKIPPHNPKCSLIKNENKLEILYPQNNSKIWIPKLDNKNQILLLKATHSNENEKIYWFLDELYLGFTKNIHQKEIFPEIGEHILKIVDDNGNKNYKKFYIIKK